MFAAAGGAWDDRGRATPATSFYEAPRKISRFQQHMHTARQTRPFRARTARPARPTSAQTQPAPHRSAPAAPRPTSAQTQRAPHRSEPSHIQRSASAQPHQRYAHHQPNFRGETPVHNARQHHWDGECVTKIGERPWRRDKSNELERVNQDQKSFFLSNNTAQQRFQSHKPLFHPSDTTPVTPVPVGEYPPQDLACLLEDKNEFQNIRGFSDGRFFHHLWQCPAGQQTEATYFKQPEPLTAIFPPSSMLLANMYMTSNKWAYDPSVTKKS